MHPRSFGASFFYRDIRNTSGNRFSWSPPKILIQFKIIWLHLNLSPILHWCTNISCSIAWSGGKVSRSNPFRIAGSTPIIIIVFLSVLVYKCGNNYIMSTVWFELQTSSITFELPRFIKNHAQIWISNLFVLRKKNSKFKICLNNLIQYVHEIFEISW
jgi:hypothetical protein